MLCRTLLLTIIFCSVLGSSRRLPSPPSNVVTKESTHFHPFCAKFNFVWGGRGGVASFSNITGKVPTILTSIEPPFRGHLYSGDTCLSPEGVPRWEVPLHPKDLREAELHYQRPKTTIVTQRSANFKIFIHHSGDFTRISRLATQFALLSLQAKSPLVDADPASPYECRHLWNYSKIKLSLKENLIGSKSPLLKQKYWVTRRSLNRTAAKESTIYIIWFPWFSSTPFERDCWKGVTLCFGFLGGLCKKMHHWLVGKLNLFSPRKCMLYSEMGHIANGFWNIFEAHSPLAETHEPWNALHRTAF